MSEYMENEVFMFPTLFIQNDPRNLNMYHMHIRPVVIVVPEALPYSEFSAYLKTITSDIFFTYFLILIASVIVMLSVFRYKKHNKSVFFQSVTDVVNLLMNDNGYIEYGLLSRYEAFLIVPLTFIGLIFVNGIWSNLQSYYH